MRRIAVHLTLITTILLLATGNGSAANWNGIEPLVTSLDDVHVKLGKPAKDTETGPVYVYPWGTVEVVAVSDQDITNKKFKPNYKSKVKGIVVELRGSAITPL